MSDRIPSDHTTVESRRIHLATIGRTGRFQLQLPPDLDCELEDVIYLSLEGDGVHAQVHSGLDSKWTINGAFRTRKAARTQDGENAFHAWLDKHTLADGDALMFDVLRTGYAFGLRRPGERVVYSPPDPPDSTLTDIARDLDS
ncbi:hypothetical protein ACFQJ7_15260 [Halovenus rubra]|uniref:Uncharacterized protein n=2 Tax=Halovenus rubra TaxID=869890 RepID=A0ACC7E2M8_9EURY|nr:hypothetical protein [Halovenus rubra]